MNYKVLVNRLIDRICLKIAHSLPNKIALLVFVRVSVADGDCPSAEYVEKYNYWVKTRKMNEV